MRINREENLAPCAMRAARWGSNIQNITAGWSARLQNGSKLKEICVVNNNFIDKYKHIWCIYTMIVG